MTEPIFISHTEWGEFLEEVSRVSNRWNPVMVDGFIFPAGSPYLSPQVQIVIPQMAGKTGTYFSGMVLSFAVQLPMIIAYQSDEQQRAHEYMDQIMKVITSQFDKKGIPHMHGTIDRARQEPFIGGHFPFARWEKTGDARMPKLVIQDIAK